MAQRWYESRTNQAAMIGGVAVVAAALIAGYFTLANLSPYPTIEIKDLSPSGEQVLARLAITPSKQLLDSSAFATHKDGALLWNDSLGVAIKKPESYEWGNAASDSLETVSLSNALFGHWIWNQAKRGFDQDLDNRIRFFSVRLDEPTVISVSAEARIDSTRVGHNPFQDIRYFLRWVRMNYGEAIDEFPADSLAMAYREINAEFDSLVSVDFPLTRRLLTGVFVARVSEEDLAKGIAPWVRAPLLDKVVGAVAQGSPSLLVIDRDRLTALFSTAVHLQGVIVDGDLTEDVTFTRAGYAVQRGHAVYVVMLQYLSTLPPTVLEELQRILESVRLRAGGLP